MLRAHSHCVTLPFMSLTPLLNFAPSTIWTADNLDVLRGMNSATVDLIYLDPPFNSDRDYAAPVGSAAEGAEFRDKAWKQSDIKAEWQADIRYHHPALFDLLEAVGSVHGEKMKCYITYMAPRLMEMSRVLKQTGSIYLHCDPTASHYLKLMLDSIFGKSAYRNEITWKRYRGRRAPKSPKNYPRVTDSIFFYSREGIFDLPFTPLDEDYVRRTYRHNDGDGKGPYRFGGRIRDRKYYLRASRGTPVVSLWDDIGELNGTSREMTGYPTQKPLALLRRIIAASSNEGDLVLDPFCGCATACVAAERLNRQWVGIDLSPKAADLVKSRFVKELGIPFDGHHLRRPPRRNDRQTPGRRYNCPENKAWLYSEQEGRCGGCNRHFPDDGYFDVDHKTPKSRGGGDELDNLQLLCTPKRCNQRKGRKTQAEFKRDLRRRGEIVDSPNRPLCRSCQGGLCDDCQVAFDENRIVTQFQR